MEGGYQSCEQIHEQGYREVYQTLVQTMSWNMILRYLYGCYNIDTRNQENRKQATWMSTITEEYKVITGQLSFYFSALPNIEICLLTV
jgi:hypothetical protein